MRKITMQKEKIKVYTYTRVSTAMQVDGYSLDAQKTKMKAYADYNDYEIVGEYEDAGKSGKSIEGQMCIRDRHKRQKKAGRRCGKHCLSAVSSAEQRYIKAHVSHYFPSYQNHHGSFPRRLFIASPSTFFRCV